MQSGEEQAEPRSGVAGREKRLEDLIDLSSLDQDAIIADIEAGAAVCLGAGRQHNPNRFAVVPSSVDQAVVAEVAHDLFELAGIEVNP